MATANKTMSATKVVIPCRISFANIFEPKSINGGDAKYSVSCLIPKADKKTLLAIHKAVEAAKEDGKTRKWGGKIPPNLKMPLRDGDIDRPDDENYQEHFFLNATSKDAPQVVDRHVQPVTDPMMVYSGCYCNVSVNFYAFNANGNGYQRQKTEADRHEGTGRQSGQASAEYQRTEAYKEGTSVSEMAGAGSKKRMAASCQADGSHRHPDRSGHGCLRRLLSGIRTMEGGGRIHHPARHHRQNALRLLAAGAAGLHCTDLSENHEPLCRAVRSDPILPKPDHCLGLQPCGCC